MLYKQGCGLDDILMYLFVRNDITVSNNLRRHFAWYNCSLHLEDISPDIGIFVSIAASDSLVHAGVAREFVELERREREGTSKVGTKPISYTVWEGFRHGYTLTSLEAIDFIKKKIEFNESGIKSARQDVSLSF